MSFEHQETMVTELETADESLSRLMATSTLDNGSTFSMHRPHPRYAMYKAHITMEACQEKRRKALLQNQRSKRFKLILQLRSLYEKVDGLDHSQGNRMGDSGSSSIDDMQCDGMEDGQAESAEDGTDSAMLKCRQKTSFFSNRLMMGEWLVDVPSDFDSNWLFTPYPQGRRCLIVANQKWTLAYNRAGRRVAKFKSGLPEETMLDCVSCSPGSTLYVLDVLMWYSQTLVDYDCEFRHFWITGRLEDVNLDNTSSNRRFKGKERFVVLPKYKYSRAMLQNVITNRLWPFAERLDGLLFYHRSCLYEPGETPLVGWLKPFMLYDMLGVTVPPEYSKADELLVEDFKKAAQKKAAAGSSVFSHSLG